MENSKITMTGEELINELVRICYCCIVRFSSENATVEEKAMLPDMFDIMARLLGL